MLRQLNALWVLGLALLRKILLMPFVRRRGGGPWLARLRAERLTPTPVAAWSRFERASRCIGCGLCDIVDAGDLSPRPVILGFGRRPEDATLVAADAERLRAAAGAIARVCPTRVGVDELVGVILDNAELLKAE